MPSSTSSASVDIVIVSYNTAALLRECLQSIEDHAAPVEVAVFVVDNASSDGSPEMAATEFPAAHVIRCSENLGFAAANNLGIREGAAPYVLCMNSDARLLPGALPSLLDCLEKDQATVVAGPRLINLDGSFQPSCRRFPTWTRNFAMYSGLTRRFPSSRSLSTWLSEEEHAFADAVEMVSGACFLVRRDYLTKTGGFDGHLFFYEEEMDLMMPARRQGQLVRYCRSAQVVHHGGASVAGSSMSAFAERQFFRSKYHVFRKHYGGAYARATYLGDLLLFTLSSGFARLRGEQGRGQALLRAAKRGWAESGIAPDVLRKDRAFFVDD